MPVASRAAMAAPSSRTHAEATPAGGSSYVASPSQPSPNTPRSSGKRLGSASWRLASAATSAAPPSIVRRLPLGSRIRKPPAPDGHFAPRNPGTRAVLPRASGIPGGGCASAGARGAGSDSRRAVQSARRARSFAYGLAEVEPDQDPEHAVLVSRF